MPVSQHLLLAPLEGPLGPSTNTPRIKTRSMCVDPFYFSNEVWLEKWCAFHCSCTSRLKIIIQCEIATKSPAFVSALQYIFISVEALNSGRGFKYLLSLSLSLPHNELHQSLSLWRFRRTRVPPARFQLKQHAAVGETREVCRRCNHEDK